MQNISMPFDVQYINFPLIFLNYYVFILIFLLIYGIFHESPLFYIVRQETPFSCFDVLEIFWMPNKLRKIWKLFFHKTNNTNTTHQRRPIGRAMGPTMILRLDVPWFVLLPSIVQFHLLLSHCIGEENQMASTGGIMDGKPPLVKGFVCRKQKKILATRTIN